MAKRKKTDTVQLKLRIREVLRRKLEVSAKANEVSLNAEMVQRLESSYLQAANSQLLSSLLGEGRFGVDLHRAIATILTTAGPQWALNKQIARNVGDAIKKVIAVYSGDLEPTDSNFPLMQEKDTSDQMAWLAIMVHRFRFSVQHELSGGAE